MKRLANFCGDIARKLQIILSRFQKSEEKHCKSLETKKAFLSKGLILLVGATGFEPVTLCL
jgi:hypothetical protein